MIEINHIHIKFKHTIIEEGNLVIHDKQITLLSGESGCGKTSLLNILGLLDHKQTFTYRVDGNVLDQSEYDEQKRTYISYVFQDYNAIEDISVRDNFKIAFNIAGEKYSETKMMGFLKQTSLDTIDVRRNCKSLSGGEKQKLAIALSLVKNPRLLLLDEPTAHLDEENAQSIVKILHTLKEQGFMIVVASHHPDLYQADHVYEIENKKIMDVNYKEHKEKLTDHGHEHLGRKKFSYLNYAILHISNHIVICAIIFLAFLCSFYSISKNMVLIEKDKEELKQSLDEIADNEIFVNNIESIISGDTGDYFSNYYKPFDSSFVDQLHELDHITSIYPYYKLVSLRENAFDENGTMIRNDNEDVNIISTDNRKIDVNAQYGEYLAITSCDSDKKIKECFKKDENVTDGVFISSQLANDLNIKNLDHTKITFSMPILMGYATSEGFVVDENDQPISEKAQTFPLNVLVKPVTFEVMGIYEKNLDSFGYYDISGGEEVFIDHRTMDNLHSSIMENEEIKNRYEKASKDMLLEGDEFFFNQTSSAYVITVDNHENVSSVVEAIQNINGNTFIKTKEYQEQKIAELHQEIFISTSLQPLMIFGVATILIVFLFVYTLHNRKKELSYLNANGIRKWYLLPVFDMSITLFFSLIISLLLYILYGPYQMLDISDYFSLILLVGLGMFALIILICLIIDQIYLKKLDTVTELRSN